MAAPFSNSSTDTKSQIKPLKGRILSGDFGEIDELNAKSLKIENIEITGQIEGGIFTNVQIINSTINSTPIGKDVPAPGCFTTLETTEGITFAATTGGGTVIWNPDTGVFCIDPFLYVKQTATIGGITITGDTIMSAVTNSDIRIQQNGIGTIFITGPITHESSHGNVSFTLQTGGYTFIGDQDFTVQTSHGNVDVCSFGDQMYQTVNGDITLGTDKSLTKGNITLVDITAGDIFITTDMHHQLTQGDIINITGTSLIDGSYTVGTLLSDTLFTLTTTSGVTDQSTTGCLQRTNLNAICLETSLVKIPENTPLQFGDSCNSIAGNTQALTITTCADLCLEVPGTNKIKIPDNTTIEFADGAFTMQNSGGSFYMSGTSLLQLDNFSLVQINTTDLQVYDPIIKVADRTATASDMQDRGIEFCYYDTTISQSSLGWFGYKHTTGNFVMLLRATNSNEIITGDVGNFELNDLTLQNLTFSSGGTIDMNCGQILEVDLITACTQNNLTIRSDQDIYIQVTDQLHLDAMGEVLVNNNVPMYFGTTGSGIIEDTTSSLVLTGDQNIYFQTESQGSVVVPQETSLTFTGTTNNSTSITGDTECNLHINSKADIYLTTTAGSIIVPQDTPIEFGEPTQNISGNTSGLTIQSTNTAATLNIISNSTVSIVSSSGNVLVETHNTGDIILNSTGGAVRIPEDTQLVFNTSPNTTQNSVEVNSAGNLVWTGDSTNCFVIRHFDTIDLSAASSVNIPDDTPLVFGGDLSIVNNTIGESYITNDNFSTGALVINALNMAITSGRLVVINDTTNVRSTYTTWSSATFTITGTEGSRFLVCSENVRFKDPILTLADYQLAGIDGKDRGIEYFYYNTAASMTHLGWFGWKSDTGNFTFYESATNNNEIITGTLGNIELGNLNVENILLSTVGTLDLGCGGILNVDTISGCSEDSLTLVGANTINMSATNLNITTSQITIPSETPIQFGTTTNSAQISGDTSGNFIVTSSTTILHSDLEVNGPVTQINSTNVSIADPIPTIGYNTTDDNTDRGIGFLWNSGGTTFTGFFGFDDSTGKFTFIPDASITGEIVSGSVGSVMFDVVCANDIALDDGTITGVREISGGEITIVTTAGHLQLQPTEGQSILIPYNTPLQWGGVTSSSLTTTTAGVTTLTTYDDLILQSSTGKIILDSTEAVCIPGGVPFQLDTAGSKSLLCNTNGDLIITNTLGDIILDIPTSSSLLLPEGSPIGFSGNTENCIYASNGELFIKGFDAVQIFSSTVNIGGDINIIGSITATDINLELNDSLLCLGTLQILPITNITTNNVSTNGNILVETISDHLFTVGDSITLQNTNSVPLTDGDYTVIEIP